MSNILALQELDTSANAPVGQDTPVLSWSTLSFAIC